MMNDDKTKMVGMYVFVADWISGTRQLTLQQRGIYWDLLAFSQTFNGRGLPNNIDDLCRLILPYEPNQDKAEELRADLIFIINNKFSLIENRFYNERQHKEFIKSKELSESRSRARKSKTFDTVLLEEKDNNLYKYKYKDNNIINNNIIEIFNDNVWEKLKYRKGSKQKAYEKYIKIKDSVDDETLVYKYNSLCEETSDPTFCPHFVTWLNQSRWLDEEVFSPDKFKGRHKINGFYQETRNGIHYFTSKEAWGVVDYFFDNTGKILDKELFYGEEKKETA